MLESQNLVVNPNSGVVHRKTCGSVNYLTMFTLAAKLFRTTGAQQRYSAERGWRGCLTCKPFAPDPRESKG